METSADPTDAAVSSGATDAAATGETTDSTAADVTGARSCDDPEAVVAEIFASACSAVGCHGTDAAAGLDLVSAAWPERLIGQPSSLCDGQIRVVPGDPDASLLVDKLRDPVACGDPMPVGASLPDAEIECIARWVSKLPPIDCPTCGGETCIDTDTDPLHCGACDVACPTGVLCDGGECACPEGTIVCGDACVDPLANGEHCGGCDIPCDGGTVCLAGACVADCGALTQCSGGCVDTTTDPLHCGGCDNACEAGGACSGGTCDCPGGPLSYAADIEPMMAADCTSMGCHGFPLPQEGLDLRTGMGYADMVDVPAAQCAGRLLVAPGQPSASYLMDKLNGTNMCAGTRMPKGAAPWAAGDIATVSAWICQGAPP